MKGSVLSTLLAAVPAVMAGGLAWPEAEGKRIKYTTVKGYFLQDEASTDPNGFDYVGCQRLEEGQQG
jgi:hypothetical protein